MIRTPAIFLRVGCSLPASLHLRQAPFDNSWMSVENTAPAKLDVAVREAGWHFMWVESACSRLGWGRTDEAATRRAIVRALSQLRKRFNTAELSRVRVSRYPGFRIAKATLQMRHIQQDASLGLIDELTIRMLAPE